MLVKTKYRIMNCEFYAVLTDGTLRRIELDQKTTPLIHDVFITSADKILNQDTEEILFDGNYIHDEDEIFFVNNLIIPDKIKEVEKNNPLGIPVLNLESESIKTLFWYENATYYFQNFDNRKLLKNKTIIKYSNKTYSKIEENALIVENIVNAIYKNDKFYFSSYANANKIFSLLEFYQAATDEDIKNFSLVSPVIIDENWLIKHSNTIIRKHITLLLKSGILTGVDTKKVKSAANKFKLKFELDKDNKIIFPKDKKMCKDMLIFLNEQYYVGLISGKNFKTSSKRDA